MRLASERLGSVVVLVFAFTVGACDSKASAPGTAAPSASVPATASAAPSPPKRAPYVGHFEGKYDAKLFRIEMSAAEGAVKQWAEDDGKALSGGGSIALDIAEDKRITGVSSGPLGTLRASGLFDEGRIRVALSPDAVTAPERAVGATLVGTLEGDRLKGTLQASTGDSLKARTATVELERRAGVSSATGTSDSTSKK